MHPHGWIKFPLFHAFLFPSCFSFSSLDFHAFLIYSTFFLIVLYSYFFFIMFYYALLPWPYFLFYPFFSRFTFLNYFIPSFLSIPIFNYFLAFLLMQATFFFQAFLQCSYYREKLLMAWGRSKQMQ